MCSGTNISDTGYVRCSGYRYSLYKDKRHASDSSASFSKNQHASQNRGTPYELEWPITSHHMHELQSNN